DSIPLSKNEIKLLKIFFINYGKVVKREELLEELWDEDEFVDDNTLTVNITRLKKRLNEKEIQLTIETKRGIGYVLR
ncbi:MAG: helix-turn-helix domain-containing protein, partial [Clostridiaceae bacterium]